jgi:hypothetical protein
MVWKTAAVSRLSVLGCLLPIHLQLLKLAWEGGTKKSKYQHRISVTLSEGQTLGGRVAEEICTHRHAYVEWRGHDPSPSRTQTQIKFRTAHLLNLYGHQKAKLPASRKSNVLNNDLVVVGGPRGAQPVHASVQQQHFQPEAFTDRDERRCNRQCRSKGWQEWGQDCSNLDEEHQGPPMREEPGTWLRKPLSFPSNPLPHFTEMSGSGKGASGSM